jgi:predicted nuclease with TOPRIM domain
MTEEQKQLLKENERLRSEIKSLKDYVDLLEVCFSSVQNN